MPEPEVTREDLKRVETRVEFVAQEVEGEKLLSRYILQQARQNGDDLAIVKTRVERVETDLRGLRSDFNALNNKFDALNNKFDALNNRFDALNNKFDSSQEQLPGMIADVMREVLRESRGKS